MKSNIDDDVNYTGTDDESPNSDNDRINIMDELSPNVSATLFELQKEFGNSII